MRNSTPEERKRINKFFWSHFKSNPMNIDVFYKVDGKEYCDEELALSILLKENVLFCNGRFYSREKDGKSEGRTVVLFVNCNDIFAWACADAEDLPFDEIGNLYRMHQSVPGGWGSAKWCCIRRNEKPQSPVQKAMKEAGAWDDILENLPENYYDKICREELEKLK